MPGSGAGLNRVGSLGGKVLFANADGSAKNITAASAVLTPGTNDTGAVMTEAKGFSAWLLQPTGTWGSGTAQVQALVFGTVDKYTAGYNDATGYHAPTANNWFPLPAPSTAAAGDSFTYDNPLLGDNAPYASNLAGNFTDGSVITDSLMVKTAGLLAIRVIVIPTGGSGAPVNPNCNILAFALE